MWEFWNDSILLPDEPEKYRPLAMLGRLLLLIYTGLRIGELLALRRSDVNLQERFIDLRGTKTKAARRRVPLHRDIIPVMARLLDLAGPELLLPGPQGRGITYSQYKGWFDRVVPALGMDHTPHDTRHTFVSALDSAGVRRAAMMFIVGHSQRDVTDRYTHKDLPELIAEVDKLCY